MIECSAIQRSCLSSQEWNALLCMDSEDKSLQYRSANEWR